MSVAKCGCFYKGAIQMCPLHSAAPRLLDVAKRLQKHLEMEGEIPVLLLQDLETVITEAERKNG